MLAIFAVWIQRNISIAGHTNAKCDKLKMLSHHYRSLSAPSTAPGSDHRSLSGSLCTTSRAAKDSKVASEKLQQASHAVFRSCSPRVHHVRHTRSDITVARMGIKWIESFESQVNLPEERKSELEGLLGNATFCKQVLALLPEAPHFSLGPSVLQWNFQSHRHAPLF